MGQSVSRRHVTAELRVRGQIVLRAICGGQSGTGAGFSQSTSALPCQYHSTNASDSFIYHRCYTIIIKHNYKCQKTNPLGKHVDACMR